MPAGYVISQTPVSSNLTKYSTSITVSIVISLGSQGGNEPVPSDPVVTEPVTDAHSVTEPVTAAPPATEHAATEPPHPATEPVQAPHTGG